jgi:hypothetical protein
MIINYGDPELRGDGWWFKRTVGEVYEVWIGPYPDELNCHYNLQRLRRNDVTIANPAINQNLFNAGGWRDTVRDIFGPTSIEAFPLRGSRG